ncbi:hypothetical protein EJ05DRAFT_440940 [Pseudovirgaria hyperparasitica]|uniref:Xylanolytic transcriptional activator regulatory domain-containing protein n=1 Tax=Pseudovirgaria hyperparasitica TaxID=470096 RepID=A0A6A6W2U5_9PEZI|nr:uncharacterized protein EJ05DRAFT_440940 [Pseudovirgaria hyperparasitica]KAF2756449.1 hypothetical protein EJ05DRAFT_440940 [Pseudovirgaria hyperparasitica]
MDTQLNLGSPAFWAQGSPESETLLHKCINLFFQNMYPIFPLVHEATFRAKLGNPGELETIDRVLILAMCALSIIQVSDVAWGNLSHDSRMTKGKDLIRQALELRLTCDFTEMSSLAGILTSLFLQTAYFELRRRRSSWFYLREAITLAQAARLHEASGYEGMDYVERICAQRIYAILFITERGASILSVLPVSIKFVPVLPADILPGEDPSILSGLQSIYTLFSLLDESFVELWNAPTEPFPQRQGHVNIAAMQHKLKALDLDTMGLTVIQSADIRVTQQWLRLVFWQAAMRQGLISSTAEDSAFTYDFPREIGHLLVNILKSLPPAAIQAHGLGIFEKQFEVAYSLLDNLTLSQSKSPEDYENLRFIFRCLSASPSSRDTYVRALETKMDNQRRPSNTAGIEFVVNWDLRTHEGRRLSVI